MPSKDCSAVDLPHHTGLHVQALHVESTDFRTFFDNLASSRHRQTVEYCPEWDLPLKRSFALIHAIMQRYQKILLIDDDIRPEAANYLTIGANCLERFSIAGCFVDDFIDTSVVGHLECDAGEDVYAFISGSFLFLRPSIALGFFPCIYNEDWLFMIPHVLNDSICSFGTVHQRAFDPFENVTKAEFQEFGDIIAEGLYSLIESRKYESRFDLSVWRHVLAERHKVLISLRKRLVQPQHERIILAALAANQRILPEDCQKFVKDWEADKMRWTDYANKMI
jgi:hypothetical protein